MTPIIASVLVSACVFMGGIAGLYFHRLLPEQHRSRETQEVVKLSTGMLSVLASLVLGLLIATAKTSYDTTDRSIRTYAAELALLNEVMRDYGAPAAVPRDLLRRYIEALLRDGWPAEEAESGRSSPSSTGIDTHERSPAGPRAAPSDAGPSGGGDSGAAGPAPMGSVKPGTTATPTAEAPGEPGHPAAFSDDQSRHLLEHVREAIRGLKPIDEGQKTLQAEATEINLNLLRQRWLLIEQQGTSVQWVVLVILVSWVTVIFASFGINAPANSMVLMAFLVGALAIGGAMFLILEMDRPLDGVMRVSSWPVRNVLAQMNW
jgi:hypothetical protein